MTDPEFEKALPPHNREYSDVHYGMNREERRQYERKNRKFLNKQKPDISKPMKARAL